MIEYFDIKNPDSIKRLKELKKYGLLGDYIYARYFSNNRNFSNSSYHSFKTLIDRTLRWNETPQGSQFWLKIYDNARYE